MFSISFIVSPRCPPPFIICSNSSIDSTSISATSIQYRSAQKSVMTRIFGMPLLAPIRFIAKNFSTIGRTLPGLQNMISRTRNMEVSRVGSVRRQQTVAASRTLNNDGSAITQNLGGRPLAADLRTLVSDSHNRIRPEFASVLEEQFVSLLTRLLAHLRVRPICPPTICFNPPKNPWPIVGDRTMMPRTRPLYSVMRYPSMEKVVVVNSVSGIRAPG